MSQTITIAGTVTPGNHAASSISGSITCDTITVTELEIAAGASAVSVPITPASTDAQIVFVLIKLDEYTDNTVPGTPDMTYQIHDADHKAIPLGIFHMWNMEQDAGLAGETATAVEDEMDVILMTNADAVNERTLTVIVGSDYA